MWLTASGNFSNQELQLHHHEIASNQWREDTAAAPVCQDVPPHKPQLVIITFVCELIWNEIWKLGARSAF